MMVLDLLLLAGYYTVLVLLTVYATHRLHLIRLLRAGGTGKERSTGADAWPSVCIQLPVYNEPAVVERLIRAAASVRYPGSLSVQVLDDSTDQTTRIIRETIDELSRTSEIPIEHVRRVDRKDYKAGALQYGLERTDAELLAIFDADFVPTEDFLLELVPHFSDPAVGMVQCRWDHLNRDESLLTLLQALCLDAHFAVESSARFSGGVFFNFNGTAGMWRRAAIVDAGGWSGETVTEDLDLSYRAQMAGWSFRFLDHVAVPSELPSTLAAFHGQQYRWAKGSIQTARRQLPSLIKADLPLEIRTEAAFHLTNNTAYLLTLLLALLIIPASVVRYSLGLTPLFVIDFLLFATCSASLFRFYRTGQIRLGRGAPSIWLLIATIPFGVGLSVVNAAAAIDGALTRAGIFNRTPKSGGNGKSRPEAPPRFPLAELILSLWLFAALAVMLLEGLYLAAPFVFLFLAGYGSTSVVAALERVEWARRSGALFP